MAKFTRDDVDKFHEVDLYIPTRSIFMGSVVNEEGEEHGLDATIASVMIKNLHILDHLAPSGDKPINIIINNIGGDELHGMSIYDAIKMCKNMVNITVIGHGMSMAAWVLQAGDKRMMTANSRLMIHTGNISLPDGHPEVSKRFIEQWFKDEKIFEEILLEKIKANKPSFTLGKVRELLRFDTFLNPEEALELNLIDEIV